MLILIHGNDEIRSRAKYQGLIDSLLAKSPEASLFKLNAENFKIENLEELTRGQGLFYKKFIVGCDNLFSGENGEIAEQLKNYLKPIAESENVFIFLENPSTTLRASPAWIELKKLASKGQEFSKKEVMGGGSLSAGRQGFNIFSVTDAFTARNKNSAWALYQEALMLGVSAEEILWKLIWSVNNLLLVKNTKNLDKLKMKPYPLKKAKTATKNFSNNELKKFSADFNDLYHTSYLGTDEFEFGLEKILLSI